MNKGILLDFKFHCYSDSNENNWPLFKNKRLLFSYNKISASPIFVQNLTLPAVTIKLYCFNLLFEHHFCLNNRPFVFSVIDNRFDFGCHSNEKVKRNSFATKILIARKVSNKSNSRLLRYYTFHFFHCLAALRL